ncbi:uncharacterized protein PPP1R15 [Calliphora vicina]|uniref:uncharacterized protein PPP1R15 n=1 Tax=Calliphora vicina TaxID=7373 RepID=UPI00325B8F36
MICNYQKTPQQTKQRQLNTCLLKNINKNFSSTLDSSTSSSSSPMSTLTADLRTAAVAAAAASNKSVVKPPMEAVVVNSIIYSKPSFCRIAVDLGDMPVDKKPTATSTKLTNGSCPNNFFNSETFCSSMGLKNEAFNYDAASCLAGLAVPPSLDVGADTQVYRMCTTINGSVHHQISDLCDNILAMAGFFGVTNNEHDDDSFIEFAYRDDSDNDDDNDDDDDDDDEEDYEDDYYDEDLDDDNDVVDFSYECPIEPAPKLNCDKKKKVRFNTKPTVHVMHTWTYAYRAARKGEWEMYARDRERFKLRIQRAALTINPILQREHRQKIYEKRFANLYNNDDDNEQHQTEAVTNSVSAEIMESKEKTSNNIESKKPHQKKKRRKKRFCKMGNKHYF